MMLLPFWTDGCIGRWRGFFESSATTPYHFLASSALSAAPSRPVRNLRYDPLDVPKGVQYMQLLGVRYYMAFSPAAVKMAREDEGLTEIATSGPWVIFEVADSEIVSPLENEPAVVEGGDKNSKSWLHVGEDFFLDPATGTSSSPRAGPTSGSASRSAKRPKSGRSSPSRSPTSRPTTTASASTSIRSVCRCSSRPVLPELASVGRRRSVAGDAQLMVVVPTSEHVSLHYGRTPIDIAGSCSPCSASPGSCG